MDLIPAVTDDEDAADKDTEEEENDEFFIDPPDDMPPKVLKVEESDDNDLDNNNNQDGYVPFSNDKGGDVADDKSSNKENDNMDIHMNIVPEGAQRQYPL